MRSKVYVDAVPFTEVALTNGETVRLYDTSGPGSEPTIGLPPLRAGWIEGRGDTAEYEGRPASLRDDGRAAVRRSAAADQFTGHRAAPRKGTCVTQLHYARRGDITDEM